MKHVYITMGTEHYLRQVLDEIPSNGVELFQNYEQSLLYHETEQENVFREGASYRVLQMFGERKHAGVLVLEYLSIRDEEIPIFLADFDAMRKQLLKQLGFQAARLAQEVHHQKFLIVSFWDLEDAYRLFSKNEHHSKIMQRIQQAGNQANFSHTDIYHYPAFRHDSK